MASVRLHHPTFASCTYVVELAQKYPVPYDCPSCQVQHANKAIHLRLDSQGDVFVAEGIFRLLQKVPTLAGLEVVDGRNAPPQFIGAVEQPKQHVILPHEQHYVPGRTQQEAERLVQAPIRRVLEEIAERRDQAAFLMGRRQNG